MNPAAETAIDDDDDEGILTIVESEHDDELDNHTPSGNIGASLLSPTRRIHKKLDALSSLEQQQHLQPASSSSSSSSSSAAAAAAADRFNPHMQTFRRSRRPSVDIVRWRPGWQKMFEALFVANTRLGQQVNVVIIFCTIVSVSVAVLDSVESIRESADTLFLWTEILLTILFFLEYVLRLWCLKCPKEYAMSFYGLVDMVSILPSFLALFYPSQRRPLIHLAVLRIFRILRYF